MCRSEGHVKAMGMNDSTSAVGGMNGNERPVVVDRATMKGLLPDRKKKGRGGMRQIMTRC